MWSPYRTGEVLVLGSIPLAVATAGLWVWTSDEADQQRDAQLVGELSGHRADDVDPDRTAPILGGVFTLTVLVGGVALILTSDPPDPPPRRPDA